jgi:YD repeat-containing protein
MSACCKRLNIANWRPRFWGREVVQRTATVPNEGRLGSVAYICRRHRRRTFLVERFTDFASPTTGIGGGTDNDQDRVTKWAYNGLDNVTALTAYNGSSASTQVTEYKYASTIDASWPTLVKYPDGSTSGGDNVQLAYHTDGTLNTRTDQRGTVLTFAYDPLRRPESQTATTLGGADPFVGQIKRLYDTLGRLTTTTSHGHDRPPSVGQTSIASRGWCEKIFRSSFAPRSRTPKRQTLSACKRLAPHR